MNLLLELNEVLFRLCPRLRDEDTVGDHKGTNAEGFGFQFLNVPDEANAACPRQPVEGRRRCNVIGRVVALDPHIAVGVKPGRKGRPGNLPSASSCESWAQPLKREFLLDAHK